MSDVAATVNFRQSSLPHRKRLVEECVAVCIWAVQRKFGKRTLLRAIREAEPIHIPVPDGPVFEVWLVAVTVPMVGNRGRWFERLAFACPVCCRPAVKLFYFFLPDSEQVSDLRCRCCHGLSYLSVNSAGNAWYRQIAVPLRKLLKTRQEELRSVSRGGSSARLREINRKIQALAGRVKSKTRIPGSQRGLKRRYRDLRLVEP